MCHSAACEPTIIVRSTDQPRYRCQKEQSHRDIESRRRRKNKKEGEKKELKGIYFCDGRMGWAQDGGQMETGLGSGGGHGWFTDKVVRTLMNTLVFYAYVNP